MEQALSHPSTDPELPSYEHRELKDLLPDLQLCFDCWDQLRGRLEHYLPREVMEPVEAYRHRIGRATFVPFFRDAITSFSGVLSRFQLNDPPSSFENSCDDIDLRGNDLISFMQQADQLALRDGGCLLTVDMPTGSVETNGQELAEGRRPYLALVERRNVLNWRVHNEGGREVLDWVVIREWAEVQEGLYGLRLEPRYRIIGSLDGQAFWRVLQIVEGPGGQLTVQVATDADGQPMEGFYTASGGKPMEHPPVVWYSGGARSGFAQGSIRLIGLAQLTIEHLRCRSDHAELKHKTAMPIPVRKGAIPGPGGRIPPLVLGPNSVVDLDANGAFNFAEPSASSLDHLANDIRHIEDLIRQQTLAFLYGDGGGKTATQAALEAAQTEASIRSVANAKHSVIQELMAIWTSFTGETLKDEAGLAMAAHVFDRPMESQDVAQLATMEQNEQISTKTFLEQIIKGGIITVVTSADEELERIAEQEPKEPELPGINDFADDQFLPLTDEQAPPQAEPGSPEQAAAQAMAQAEKVKARGKAQTMAAQVKNKATQGARNPV